MLRSPGRWSVTEYVLSRPDRDAPLRHRCAASSAFAVAKLSRAQAEGHLPRRCRVAWGCVLCYAQDEPASDKNKVRLIGHCIEQGILKVALDEGAGARRMDSVRRAESLG